MELDSLKEKYKELPFWARAVLVSVLTVLPALYIFYDESEVLNTKLTETQNTLDATRIKFESARTKKANLPALEEKLLFTQEELAKARAKLPDSYQVEVVVQKVASIAKEMGVELTMLRPTPEKTANAGINYKQLPILTEAKGKFGQLAMFWDKIVHLEESVFLEGFNVEVAANRDRDNKADDIVDPDHRARVVRDQLTLTSKFSLILFRSLTDAEMAAENAKNQMGKKT